MTELSIDVFVPIVAELQALAKEAREVDVTNPEAVKNSRLALKNKRVEVTKRCKEYRDDANAFSKAVIAKEKELVAIIEPEEERLQEIEAQAKQIKEKEERKALIPVRQERLAAIGDTIEVTEEELLDMDGATFEGYFNRRQADKMQFDRDEIARKQAEMDARENELKAKEEAAKREEEAKAREEKARQEERERIEREQKEKEEREVREKKEAEEKAERERIAKEEAEAEEKRKLEASKKFQTWLQKQGYTEETKADFKLVDLGGEVKLYKLVGSYKK